MKIFLAILVVLLVVDERLSKELPFNIKPCKQYDNACAIKTGNEALPALVKGDKKNHLPSMLPLKLPKIEVESGPNLKIELTDVVLWGLDTISIVDYNQFRDKLAFLVKLHGKRLEVAANYKINGKILVLPIQGNGPMNITVENCDVAYTFNYVFIEKDGDKYFKIEPDDVLDMTIGKAYFHLDNLFNGNQQLGDNMNKFLNDNWKEVYEELGGPISATIKAVVRQLASQFSQSYPFSSLFID